jgi:hydroxyethylthiazole kinase-like uncharacterized protein yjeF
MREVDRLAEASFGLTPVQLMEMAGLATARVARRLLGPSLSGRAIRILAGPGNNGADGLVAARRLSGWGADVAVLTSYPPAQAGGLPARQLGAAVAAGVTVQEWTGSIGAADLVVDALLGFGASGPPRGLVADMIEASNRAGGPVLALDLPSGIDPDSGRPGNPCIRADLTVTLGVAKTGLLSPDAVGWVGRLLVADIGLPVALLAAVGIDATGLFEFDDIVELGDGGRVAIDEARV